MDRGVGVERADKDLDLGVDALLLFGGLTHNGESSNTFAIEALSQPTMHLF
jgi:hypothetical protein